MLMGNSSVALGFRRQDTYEDREWPWNEEIILTSSELTNNRATDNKFIRVEREFRHHPQRPIEGETW